VPVRLLDDTNPPMSVDSRAETAAVFDIESNRCIDNSISTNADVLLILKEIVDQSAAYQNHDFDSSVPGAQQPIARIHDPPTSVTFSFTT
jgi:hypothetical protein